MERSVKHFSLGKGGFAAGACAIAFALSVNLIPVSAQEQENGSLEDMWQEAQDEKPAAAPEKSPTKKSSTKKSKKSKSEAKPTTTNSDGDLTTTKKEAAPGWASDLSPKPTESADNQIEEKPASDTKSASSPTPASSGAEAKTPLDSESGSALSRPVTAGTNLEKYKGSKSKASSGASATEGSSKAKSDSSGSVWSSPANSPTAPVSSNLTDADLSTSSSSSSSSAASNSTADADSSVAKIDGPTQPLCKFSALTSSDLIKSGGWPGVGPFAQDKTETDALVDEAKNKLTVKLSGDDVTHAELLLVNQSPKPNQLLAVQMTADFLLEAVGAQSGKIADFNSALLNSQDKLASGTADATVNLKAGTYLVQIQKKPAQDATVPGNVAYLIALDNQKPAVVASASTPKLDNTSFSVFTPNAGSQASTQTSPTTLSTPATTTTSSSSTQKTVSNIQKTGSTAKTAVASKPPAEDLLHKQFSNLINNWQQIKRSAVKTRQSDSLSRILGGKALSTQNIAIQWLLDNKKYYEMTPLELKIQSYREVTPGSKFEVDTYIKERRQLMNANTMKAEKDSTSAYNVIYTVEKIRGSWLITDTRMSSAQ
jgi:hypothetical protein